MTDSERIDKIIIEIDRIQKELEVLNSKIAVFLSQIRANPMDAISNTWVK